jgi:hypothetical protein
MPIRPLRWTVLLPSDTYRKPIKSITAVLLLFCDLFTDSPSYLKLFLDVKQENESPCEIYV